MSISFINSRIQEISTEYLSRNLPKTTPLLIQFNKIRIKNQHVHQPQLMGLFFMGLMPENSITIFAENSITFDNSLTSRTIIPYRRKLRNKSNEKAHRGYYSDEPIILFSTPFILSLLHPFSTHKNSKNIKTG